MKIGLDVDDVLLPCTQKAIDALVAVGAKFDPKAIEWDFSNLPPDLRRLAKDKLHEPQTFSSQRPFEGAVEMVNELLKRGHEVYFVTAPYPRYIAYRYEQLRRFFPNVPERNIIIGGDKSVIALDVLLDDAPHNLESSIAKHVVQWECPWNRNCKREDMETAHSYDEFLGLIDKWDDRYPQIICLVGPSASGKTTVSEELVKTGQFITPRSVTTRRRREGESEDAYQFITEHDFSLLHCGRLVEYTCYNGFHYGLTYEEIDRCMASGKTIVVPVDINGAAALKAAYGCVVVSAFMDRPLNDILDSLQKRHLSDDVMLSRLASMKEEMRNRDKVDTILDNSGTIAETVNQVREIANTKLCELWA